MLRTLGVSLLALTLGVLAAVWLRADTGYVLLSWHHWVLETSVLGFTAALIGATLLLYALSRLIFTGLQLPARVRERLRRQRIARARDSFESGLSRLLQGQWSRAEIELVRRAADHPAGALNYLLAARAAHQQSEYERRDHYLTLASRYDVDSQWSAQLARAEFHLEQEQFARARELLQPLHERQPDAPYVSSLLAETLARVEDWLALHALLSRPAVVTALKPERRQALAANAAVGMLRAAAHDGRLDFLKARWELSAPWRGNPLLRRAYVRGLIALNAHTEAAAQIAQGLREGWDGELALCHADLLIGDDVAALAVPEQWLADFGEKPELLWVAARACVRGRLWGKARAHLDALLRVQPAPAVYRELAALCEATQNPADAAAFRRQGLELAVAQRAQS